MDAQRRIPRLPLLLVAHLLLLSSVVVASSAAGAAEVQHDSVPVPADGSSGVNVTQDNSGGDCHKKHHGDDRCDGDSDGGGHDCHKKHHGDDGGRARQPPGAPPNGPNPWVLSSPAPRPEAPGFTAATGVVLLGAAVCGLLLLRA